MNSSSSVRDSPDEEEFIQYNQMVIQTKYELISHVENTLQPEVHVFRNDSTCVFTSNFLKGSRNKVTFGMEKV